MGSLSGGRPSVSPLIKLFTFLMPKGEVKARLTVEGNTETVPVPAGQPLRAEKPACAASVAPAQAAGSDSSSHVTVPLAKIAYARSGDKGDSCNVGVIARDPRWLEILRAQLTEQAVGAHLAHLVAGPVERFDVPGIHGMNFLLHRALGGGGMASLRNDPLGKAMAQILLAMPVSVPRAVLDEPCP